MSVKQMTLVWELDLDPNLRLLLLALADHADDEGNNVYPSVEHLAWKVGYSGRQVRRNLQILRDEMKVLELVESGGGRGKSNRYRLHLDACEYKQPYDGPNLMTESKRRELLSWLLEKHEMTCTYCGEKGDKAQGPDSRSWHVDRTVTGRHGGKYEKGNVVLACGTCNVTRHRKPKHKKGDDTSPFKSKKGDIEEINPDIESANPDIAMSDEPSLEPSSLEPTPVGANGHIDHIRVLVDALRIQSVELSKQDKEQYAGQVSQLRNAGKSEQDIQRGVLRLVADWPNYPYTSIQKALTFTSAPNGKAAGQQTPPSKTGGHDAKEKSRRTEGYEDLFGLSPEQEEKARQLLEGTA